MDPTSQFEEILEDVAERIGRYATDHMLAPNPFEMLQYAAAGYLGVSLTLHTVCDFFDEDDVEEFVDELRNSIARLEEMAA